MSESEFDFIVVGAGIVGSWAAKDLSNHGKVLLLEQFREPHTRGSSQGQTRIIRSGYAEDFFAEIMPRAFKMWRQAESEMKEKLIETVGLLNIEDSPEDENIQSTIKNMKRLCPEYLVELSGQDIKQKYPRTLNYPENIGVILDKSGGVLFAHKAVRTIQQWYQNSGGIFWDSCKVSKIEPISASKVKIRTSKGNLFAKSVVVCAGPWTMELLKDIAPPLPLQPMAVKVYYWKEKEAGVYSASSGFPNIRHHSKNSTRIYLLPSMEYPGLVKVCAHGGVPTIPDERDKAPTSIKLENLLKDYVKDHYPLLEHEPAVIETCMYTCTPDDVFIIDALPGHSNIVIGAGFSGTGFKTSPIVGRLLSELARGEKPLLDLTPYRMSRFTTS